MSMRDEREQIELVGGGADGMVLWLPPETADFRGELYGVVYAYERVGDKLHWTGSQEIADDVVDRLIESAKVLSSSCDDTREENA
jgi:hypothetical protein